MTNSVLAVHERIGTWGRQLRSRLLDRSVLIVETRSVQDLERVLHGAASPVLLIDVGRNVRSALSDLVQALQAAPDALTLIVDPNSLEGVATVALELGATRVLSGPATPNEVMDVMTRWLSIAQERGKRSGWTRSESEPDATDPWGWLVPQIHRGSTGQRTPGN